MGYEIKLLIGKSLLRGDEHAEDKEHPFDDGSGFPYLKDENGDYVKTGRKESWFQIMAELDLCKLGYQDDPLNKLISDTIKKAKDNADSELLYFYGTDGNTRYTEDRYGDPCGAVAIQEVVKAIHLLPPETMEYRRLKWAKALLEAMADDSEQLEVVFYGH